MYTLIDSPVGPFSTVGAIESWIARIASGKVAPDDPDARERALEKAGEDLAFARALRDGKADPATRSEGNGVYVARRLENVDELRAWWESVRLPGEPALDDDPHVTVAYSKVPFPVWPDDEPVTIEPGAIRGFGVLGAMNSVVLLLDSPILQARWKATIDAGAQWDYDSYQPHITLFALGGDMLDGEGESTETAMLVRRWRDGEHDSRLPDFALVLGPEYSEPIKGDDAETRADWNEADHPRADDGKFGFGTGGGGASVATDTPTVTGPALVHRPTFRLDPDGPALAPKKAVAWYIGAKGAAFHQINGSLRVGEYQPDPSFDPSPVSQEALPKIIRGIDRAIAAEAPFDAERTFYRAMQPARWLGFNKSNADQWRESFVDRGFVSTTASLEHAQGFTEHGHLNYDGEPKARVVEIHVPAGARAYNVNAHFDTEKSDEYGFGGFTGRGEQEFLLPRGGRYRITGTTPDSVFGWRYVAEYEPPPVKGAKATTLARASKRSAVPANMAATRFTDWTPDVLQFGDDDDEPAGDDEPAAPPKDEERLSYWKDFDQRARNEEEPLRLTAARLFAEERMAIMKHFLREEPEAGYSDPAPFIRKVGAEILRLYREQGVVEARWKREYLPLIAGIVGRGVSRVVVSGDGVSRRAAGLDPTKLAETAGGKAARIVAPTFDLQNPWVIDAVNARAANLAGFVGQTTGQQITAALHVALNNAMSMRETAELIDRNVFGLQASQRSTMIAQTECLVGDVSVEAAEATALYRRWYEGPVVTVVTSAGRKITGTPNHPVLTDAGWRTLGELKEGDNVVCHARDIEPVGSAVDPDMERVPATIAEIFDAASAVFVGKRRASGPPDFHGDGQNGYVDVRLPDGVLLVGDFTAIDESRVDGVLPEAAMRKVLAASDRAPFARADVVGHAMGQPVAANRDAGHPEPDLDGVAVDAELSSNIVQGATRLVRRHDIVGWHVVPEASADSAVREVVGAGGSEGSHDTSGTEVSGDLLRAPLLGRRDLLHTQTAKVEIDRVSDVSVSPFAGHVFNFTTKVGYYVAAGIYTGNTVGALNQGTYTGAKLGGMEEKSWVTQGDPLVRESHNDCEAEGWIALDDTFGNGLMHPGDQTGDASEVCGCRCAVMYRPAQRSAVDRRWDEGDHPRAPAGSGDGGQFASGGGGGVSTEDGDHGDDSLSVSRVKAPKAKAPASPQTKTPAFARWFGKSKVVNDAGDPLVVYHGTHNTDFDAFDEAKAGTVRYSDWGQGIYLTPSHSYADSYRIDAVKENDAEYDAAFKKWESLTKGVKSINGAPQYSKEADAAMREFQAIGGRLNKSEAGRVISAYVRIENPYIQGYASNPDPYLSRQARESGHDGIFVLDGNGAIDEVIAFKPEQIKSATDNDGSFSPDDKRITRASPPVGPQSSMREIQSWIRRLVGGTFGPEASEARASALFEARAWLAVARVREDRRWDEAQHPREPGGPGGGQFTSGGGGGATADSPDSSSGSDDYDRPAPKARPNSPMEAVSKRVVANRTKWAGRAVDAAREPGSGFSVIPRTLHPAQGLHWMVSLKEYERQIPAAALTQRDIVAYRFEHLGVFRQHPAAVLGGWHNPEDSLTYLDVSRSFDTHAEADAFARVNRQHAVYDFETGKTHPVVGGRMDEKRSADDDFDFMAAKYAGMFGPSRNKGMPPLDADDEGIAAAPDADFDLADELDPDDEGGRDE